MRDKRITTLLKLFGTSIVVLILATVGYKELPIVIHYSLLGEDSFYAGLITNMYNSVIDFFVFSIVLYVFLGRHDREDTIQRYKENIDDCRHWFAEEAAFKNAGNIRRLMALGVNEFDLSKTTLKNTKLKKVELLDTRLMGTCLDGSNFDDSKFERTDFKGASAKCTSFNNVILNECNLKYFAFHEGQMKSSRITDSDLTKADLTGSTFRASVFKGCSFEGAKLDRCNFERADLRNTEGLTIAQLLQCASIKYARLNPQLTTAINAINPKLLK